MGLSIGRAFVDGRAERLAIGRERRRTIIMHQAARKFDPAAAKRLESYPAGADGPDRLVEVGGLVIDSADGEAFRSRVAVERH